MLLVVCLCGPIAAPLVRADTFDFTISGGQSGSGTFTTDPLSGGTYLITGITGTYDSFAITGLSVALNADNLLYASPLYPDVRGISFTYDSTVVNVYDNVDFIQPPVLGDQIATLDPSDDFSDVTFSVTSPTGVPEPLSYILMPTGLLALALVARARTPRKAR